MPYLSDTLNCSTRNEWLPQGDFQISVNRICQHLKRIVPRHQFSWCVIRRIMKTHGQLQASFLLSGYTPKCSAGLSFLLLLFSYTFFMIKMTCSMNCVCDLLTITWPVWSKNFSTSALIWSKRIGYIAAWAISWPTSSLMFLDLSTKFFVDAQQQPQKVSHEWSNRAVIMIIILHLT
jgi:hypothetical protein